MTERKPQGMDFTSWIDKQVAEAAERGAFDNLPGAGKPLPRRDDADDGQAWIRDWLEREGVSAEVLLPTPLKLRKESAQLTETVPQFRSEEEVRAAACDLNRRIVEWRRIPLGPPIFVPLVDADVLVTRWREGRPAPAVDGTSPGETGPADDLGASTAPGSRRPRRRRSRRWWR